MVLVISKVSAPAVELYGTNYLLYLHHYSLYVLKMTRMKAAFRGSASGTEKAVSPPVETQEEKLVRDAVRRQRDSFKRKAYRMRKHVKREKEMPASGDSSPSKTCIHASKVGSEMPAIGDSQPLEISAIGDSKPLVISQLPVAVGPSSQAGEPSPPVQLGAVEQMAKDLGMTMEEFKVYNDGLLSEAPPVPHIMSRSDVASLAWLYSDVKAGDPAAESMQQFVRSDVFRSGFADERSKLRRGSLQGLPE